jgi:hypothetical protein
MTTRLAAINFKEPLIACQLYKLNSLMERIKNILYETVKKGESVVELSLSTMNTGVYEPLTYLVISVIFVVCAVYLVRHYLKVRENITLLFVAFFAVVPFFTTYCFLIITDVINFDLIIAVIYMFLVSVTILAIIGLVMLGVKQLYTLPLFVLAIAFFHYTVLASNHTQAVNSAQIFSLVFTKQFIGNPWYIALKDMFPNFLPPSLQSIMIVNLLFDPLAIMLPNTSVNIISLYLSVIVIPTAVLFYLLAWKNRSGRSLGFALGLTSYIILGILVSLEVIWLRSIADTVLTFIGLAFFALGILGLLDKLMKRKEHQKADEKEKYKLQNIFHRIQ